MAVKVMDASATDCRLLSGLLTSVGYEQIVAEDMEAAQNHRR